MPKFFSACLLAAGFLFAFSMNAVHAGELQGHVPLSEHISSQYQCDLGDQLTIYTNVFDDGYVKLRWQAKLYRMSRKMTTTGAERFENRTYGLVLISIPDKSMLFDSHRGRQLANECRSQEQRNRYLSAGR